MKHKALKTGVDPTTLADLLADYSLTPGSPAAKAKGCTCPAQDTATDTYQPALDCPIHGMAALAEIVGNGPNEDEQ